MREHTDLAAKLGIDEVKLGREMCRAAKTDPDFCGEASEDEAREKFRQAVKKVAEIRTVSSPILKVVTLARNMDQLLGILGSAGEISDADVIFNMVYYIVVTLQSDSDPALGAKLIEEFSYIDNFMHED